MYDKTEMSKYEIVRWDAVIVGNNTHPYPMVYIKPDRAFLAFAKENSYAITVEVEGTNSIYDGKQIIATVDSLENSRPNMARETGLYTITLYGEWVGYPKNLGFATIRGLRTPSSDNDDNNDVPIKIDPGQPNDTKENLNTTQIALLFLAIFLIFGILFYVSRK